MDMLLFAEARKARGLEIARSKKIAKVNERLFAVPSQTNSGKWVVDPESGTCMCPDFETHGKKCKHLYAVEFSRHQVTNPDGTTVVTDTVKITYPQNWAAYNAAQTTEKDTVQILLKDLCSGVPQPKYKGTGRRELPWSDVLYGACMKVYSGMSARRASTDIRECHNKGLISADPHFNTVLRYLNKPEATPILHTLIQESAAPLAEVERNFAIDSTGFSTSTYARYFDHKYKKESKYQQWISLHAMVGTNTNIVTAVKSTEFRLGDAPQLPELLNITSRNFRNIEEVSADKAYMSNRNLNAIEAVGARPFIPFKPNHTVAGGGESWKKLFHLFSLEQDTFAAHYHRRSNVESTFSAIKRLLGPDVAAKKPQAQVNEVLVKCLVYNTTVLSHSIHDLGIEPKFWLPKGAV